MATSIDLYQPILGNSLLEWFTIYGYLILLPLLVLEGRVVGLIAAALAHVGYFNIMVVWILMVLAGFISDTFYYFLGRSGSRFMNRYWITRKLSRRIGENETVRGAPRFFEKHGAKTFFLTKAVSSLSWPLQIAAGASRMDTRRYYAACMAGNLVWSTLFAAIGYFMGYIAQRTSIYLVIALSVIIIATIYYLGKKVSRHFSKEDIFGQDIK